MAYKRKTPGDRLHLEGFLLRERKEGERETAGDRSNRRGGRGDRETGEAEEAEET